MKRWLAVGIVLATAMLSVQTVTAAGPARDLRGSSVDRVGRYLHYQVAEQARRSALGYWTPERMANAEPRGVTRSGGPVLPSVPGDGREEGHAPTPIHGVAPSATPEAVSAAAVAAAPIAYDYPFPYSRYEMPGLADYTAYPYSAIGKIFATDSLGDYVCSGAAVVSQNESVVFTAGHCVHNAGEWFANLIFVPAYRDGAAPFGQWVAVDAWAPNAWILKGDSRADYAAVIVDLDPTGATLVDTVGALGFAYSQSRIQHWQMLGYPAAGPFDGERQHVCSASFALDDPNYRRRSPIGLGCDMTGGSSGGPWILDFGGGYYLNGVISYGYGRMREATFGPYFGGGANGLYQCATDGVC